MNEPMEGRNPHVLSGEVAANILINSAKPENKMLMSFGVTNGSPLFTIYRDGEPLVTLWRDGTCKIENELYLDEAAKLFLKAVASITLYRHVHPGYVLRKQGVSEFLQVDVQGENWIQDVDQATQFARVGDVLPFLRTGYEAVPVNEAMDF